MTDTATTEATVNEYGIPLDPKAASEAVGTSVIITEGTDNEPADGPVIGKFTISVKEGEVEIYVSKAQPFGYTKTGKFSDIFANYEGKDVKKGEAALGPDQEAFVGQAFPGEKQHAVLNYFLRLHNDNERDKAKANEYARVLGLYKPLSEEDKADAMERAVKNLVKATGISMEAARALLATAGK